MPTTHISRDTIPNAEFDRALELMFADPKVYDPAATVAAYKSAGLKVIRDPATPRLLRYARTALEQKQPLSVVRVGDGEAAIITWGLYRETPALDRFIAFSTALKQEDSFAIGDKAMARLRDLLTDGVRTADIVGVAGLWKDDGPTRGFRKSPEQIPTSFRRWPRGLYGDWKGRVHFPELARRGFFRRDQVIASHHLYFAFLDGIDQLAKHARTFLLMTSQPQLHDAIAARYPDVRTDLIPLGHRNDPRRRTANRPFFFKEYRAALPDDMAGTLALIGGGPWALPYCSWVKERGGVAIDMGTGMDLLAGRITRPTHRRLSADKTRGYAIIPSESGDDGRGALE